MLPLALLHKQERQDPCVNGFSSSGYPKKQKSDHNGGEIWSWKNEYKVRKNCQNTINKQVLLTIWVWLEQRPSAVGPGWTPSCQVRHFSNCRNVTLTALFPVEENALCGTPKRVTFQEPCIKPVKQTRGKLILIYSQYHR